MPRKAHKYHYLYKTTNLINNKFYFGMHSTSNLEDEYLGSGKRLRYSIRKYGKENFKIEHLEFFETREQLIEAEIKLINENLLKDPLCMNLRLGGDGGFYSIEACRKGAIEMNKIINSDPGFIFRRNERLKQYREKNLMEGKIISMYYNWIGKKHTSETKKKMKNSKINHGIGEKNSQYGTCWITNNIENKKIKKEELDKWISNGWFKGRIIKN